MGRPMLYREINPGDVFGRLTVLCKVGYSDKVVSRINYYRCLCICGVTKDIRRNHLLGGKTVSCGCYKRSFKLKPPGHGSFVALYNICKHSAKVRDLEFSLTKEEHRALVELDCFYCAKSPKPYNYLVKVDNSTVNQGALNRERAWILANGVDRLDNSLGYILSNCVSCCFDCNIAKLDKTQEEFVSHCRRVVAHQEKLKETNGEVQSN